MSQLKSHVNPELLAYLDGELNEHDRTRVELHLQTCAACAQELETLRGLRAGLAATLPATLNRLTLPAAAAARIRARLHEEQKRSPRWGRVWQFLGLGQIVWQRRVALTYVTLALLVALFGVNAWRASRVAETGDRQETLVLASEQFAPGSPASVRVLVRDAHDATPVPAASVTVSVASRAPGHAKTVVFTGQTDAFGAADVLFTVPADLEGEAELLVETRSVKGSDAVTHPIQVKREYKLLLSSDKPVYQPGQTIHLRALALGAVDRRPAAGQEITFAVLNPNGDKLVQRAVVASEYGIASLDFPLDSQAPQGAYTLQATLDDTSHGEQGRTISEREVRVQPYSLPKFKLALETERTFYRPGDSVEGSVQADYFFGKAVVGGQVTLRGYVYDGAPQQVIELYGKTDNGGRFEFGFTLPESLVVSGPEDNRSAERSRRSLAQFGLTVEIVDEAEHREAVSRLLPVSQELILIEAVAESGTLKPGVENIVFVLTSTPDGRPAETTLTVEVNGRQTELQTGPYGLAEFRFVPTHERATLRITARDAAGAETTTTLTLETDPRAHTLLLRAERAAYRVGETLRVETLVPDPDEHVVYLDIVKAGQTIWTTAAAVESGRAVLAVDLDERFFGTLELHAYHVLADGEIVRDTRVVVVDAPREIAIAIASDRDDYRPGDTAALEIQTWEDGELGAGTLGPIQTALGIGIVDESVYAIEDQTPGFARMYFLLQKELLQPTYEVHGFELPALLEADAASPVRAAQDLSAKAAWAGAPVSSVPRQLKSSYADKLAALLARELAALRGLGRWLTRALVALPLLLAIVAIWGLQPSGALKKALRRISKGVALLVLTSPISVPAVGAALWVVWETLGVAALALTLLTWLVLWTALTLQAWRGGDRRVQIAAGLAGAYLVLSGLMALIAAHDGDPAKSELAGVALAYLLALLALITLGQGLVVEGTQRFNGRGARGNGWMLTALGLLFIPITVFSASVPGVASEFVRALGSPTVYTLPAGLLVGCSSETKEIVVTQIAKETVIETVVETVVEKETVVETVVETVIVPARPTEAPFVTQVPFLATPTPAPTSPAMEPTAAPTTEPEAPTPPAQPPRLRQFFPETLYWVAEAITDESGHLTLDVPLADSITTWRLTALASSQEGKLGATTYGIRVFQPFFVDIDLPPSLTAGDEVRVPVAVYNYLAEPQTVQLELSVDGPLANIQSSNIQSLTIAGNDIEVVYWTIQAAGHGTGRLTLTAYSDAASDAIARDIRVEPDGSEVRESLSNRLGEGVEIELSLPEMAVAGTGRLEVRLYAGPMAQLLQGLTSMLQMPTGCFEQTSSANYPNALILASGARRGAGLRPEVKLQAETFLAMGYQRLLAYEVEGGGFSLFGDAPASLMLTAYGLMEFSDMARVYPVDPAVIARTAEWLFDQQASDGAWDPHALGYTHHESWNALADARLPTTAYVAWSLTEAGYRDDPRLQFAFNYLSRNLDKAGDAYVLALVANALTAANGRNATAGQAVDQLADLAQWEGDAAHWTSRTESFSGAVGASAGLETTALATYALLRDGRHLDLADAGLLYLVQQQDTRGGWGTTQATVLALKAFNLAGGEGREAEGEATVEVYLDGQLAREVSITPENADVLHTVYLDGVEAGTHRLKLAVEGDESSLLYQAVLAYYVPWASAPSPTGEGVLGVDVGYDRTALKVDETMVADVRLSLNQPGTAQWVLVELGLPPGFDIVTEDLEALVAQSAGLKTHIKRYEVAGRALRLYLENLSGSVRFNFRLRARLVVRAQTGAVTAYDYYNPTVRDVQPPTMVVVNE